MGIEERKPDIITQMWLHMTTQKLPHYELILYWCPTSRNDEAPWFSFDKSVFSLGNYRRLPMGIWFEMLEYAVGVGGHCTPHAPGGSTCPSTCAKLDPPPPDLVAANAVRAADQKKEPEDYPLISAQNMVFSVNYFLELCNATSI